YPVERVAVGTQTVPRPDEVARDDIESRLRRGLAPHDGQAIPAVVDDDVAPGEADAPHEVPGRRQVHAIAEAGDRVDQDVAVVEPDAVALDLVAGPALRGQVEHDAGRPGDYGRDRAVDLIRDGHAVEGIAGEDVAGAEGLATDDIPGGVLDEHARAE